MITSIFQSNSRSSISFNDLADLIKAFLQEDETAFYSLTIGTDSEIKIVEGKRMLELITAVVIHRKGFGGRYFWSKKRISVTKSLREKIYQEVLLSVEAAKLLVPQLRVKLNGSSHYDLEIHIDVGENGKTREMIKEVVSIVSGNGFVARTKPYSYAASNIADRHT